GSDDAGTGAKNQEDDGFLPDPSNNDDVDDTPVVPDPINPGRHDERPPLADFTPASEPEAWRLEIVGDAELGLNYYNETVLEVLYLDGEGDPVRGGQVDVEFAG